jgi:hypothetical protein
MPRHNCSDLQRFCKNLDRSQVSEKYAPEVGPYIWKLSTKGGVITKPEERRVRGFNGAMGSRLERVKAPFPVFYLDGHKVSAFRWLYLQMYDDRDQYDGGPEKWLCRDQHKLPIHMYTHDPTKMVKATTHSPHVRPWNMLFWFDPKYTPDWMNGLYPKEYMPVDDKTLPIALSRVRRRSEASLLLERRKGEAMNMSFPRPALVYPEYVGLDRLRLVQHFLEGGTDADKPERTGIKPSKAWRIYAKKNGLTV